MEEATGAIRVMKALDREARPKHVLVSWVHIRLARQYIWVLICGPVVFKRNIIFSIANQGDRCWRKVIYSHSQCSSHRYQWRGPCIYRHSCLSRKGGTFIIHNIRKFYFILSIWMIKNLWNILIFSLGCHWSKGW